MFCSKCGKEIGDTSRFCSYCGNPKVPIQSTGMPNVGMQNTGPRRNPNKKIGIGISAIVLIVLAVVFVIFSQGEKTIQVSGKNNTYLISEETDLRWIAEDLGYIVGADEGDNFDGYEFDLETDSYSIQVFVVCGDSREIGMTEPNYGDVMAFGVEIDGNESIILLRYDEKSNKKYIPSNDTYTFVTTRGKEVEYSVLSVPFKAKVVELLIKAKDEYPYYDLETLFETEKYEIFIN